MQGRFTNRSELVKGNERRINVSVNVGEIAGLLQRLKTPQFWKNSPYDTYFSSILIKLPSYGQYLVLCHLGIAPALGFYGRTFRHPRLLSCTYPSHEVSLRKSMKSFHFAAIYN